LALTGEGLLMEALQTTVTDGIASRSGCTHDLLCEEGPKSTPLVAKHSSDTARGDDSRVKSALLGGLP